MRAIALMMKAASTSETSANFYQTTRLKNPEDNHRRLKNVQGWCDLFVKDFTLCG
jgi:hypothetical protein